MPVGNTLAVALLLVGLALIVVPWLLYPAVVTALAALRPPRPASGDDRRTPSELPRVTCVLATRDDPSVVAERVADFLAQDYPPERLDVVVAADGAVAPMLLSQLRSDDPRVTFVAGDAPGGKCPALNAAVRSARGDVLLFSDAAQRFDPLVARKLVAALQGDSRVGITSGRLLLPEDERASLFRLYSRYELALRAAEARLHSAVGVSGSVYAMWRRLWAPLPAGLILDDVYVPMRLALAGERVGFVADAFAHETRRVNAGQEFRRKVRTLTGNYQLCAWLPATLVPFRNPIWVQFVCHKLLRLVLPVAVLLVAVGGALLVLRAAGRYAPWLVGGAALAALWMAAGRDAVARKLRGVAVQFGSMQAAVVVAAIYGLRGRWDVWHR